MSDHQDSYSRTYNRSWEEIEEMLDKAERMRNEHIIRYENFRAYDMQGKKQRKKMMYHARNAKALEGTIKTLKWVLGEKGIAHPLN